ncbi:GNAT family N-acetyltransferase [Nostoc sp. 'Peltigera malacea cyanobiont' DB3992]|uniref:GNAT family N-acetyltransferase n=1 Tax=Nostoc sp. 'Peltigera malacea cyanobiont' DB3992 TaxID=1206980 RepID=UPI000C03BC81|nr:GNAT family N-acetyltransferase [Nostoc sp. 'Peltigera malacea cyanobiont' DB3992]PHM08307.1 GNAT family N-acetyltransferase [Nostoc sp. 'Peltigera malacea cyanobiont' DB3992]
MSEQLLPGYIIRRGSLLERSLLLKFMQRTYQDLFPNEDFSHLEQTVKQYFSSDTPLWWVEDEGEQGAGSREQGSNKESLSSASHSPIACLWVGNAIDQVHGNRHAHIFILYVVPEHRRRGIGTALMRYVENWAIQRGDRQIGLQVFQSNKPALNLYNQLGYQTQSLWMVKFLSAEK